MYSSNHSNWGKAAKTVSMTVAVQLALSTSLLPVIAETEATAPGTISNSTLPLAQPQPSSFVKKIWGTLDMRKYVPAKKTQVAAKAPVPTKESNDADTSASNVSSNTESAPLERIQIEDSSAAKSSIASKPKKAPEVKNDPPPGAANNKGSDAAVTVDNVDSRDTLLNTDNAAASTETKKEGVPTAAVEANTTSASTTASTEPAANKVETVETTSTASSDAPITIASNLVTLPPGSILGRVQSQSASTAVVVDNDEAEEVEETLKFEEIPTDEGKTRAKVGARFPVVISSQITSKTAKKGDPVQARLKYDLKIGDRLVAKKGAVVNGHVNYSLKARTILHSLVSPERWYRNSGCVGIDFDEIINDKGEHLPLAAQPSRQARIVKNKGEGRELGVNHYGQVTGPWSQQLRYKAVRIGLNAALAPAGVFSFGAMPVALGVLGAANPSFAFSKPVGLNVRHRRLKGFAWGFLSGIPGSWLIEDTTVKGQEAIIKPGDEFYCELVQEFTGEPATDAQLMPGASTKLHGQVLTDPKKDKKKKK